MAKSISSGIERQEMRKKTDSQKEVDQYAQQWKQIRNRIDVILMSNNVMKSNELRQQCLALDNMTRAERDSHITVTWGPLYLQKVEPLLQQLDMLESHIAAAHTVSEKPQSRDV